MATATIQVHAARFLTSYVAFEQGCAGSTYLCAYLLVTGSFHYYIWWSHAADGAQRGIDPGDFIEELDGVTGHEIALPAGTTTAEDHAELVADLFITLPGITSAAVMSENSDGSWSVEIEGSFNNIRPGLNTYTDIVDSGIHGGHVYRPSVFGDGVDTYLSIDVTRPIASRIAALPDEAIVYFAQVTIGSTAGTGSSARPRLALYGNGTSTVTPGALVAATLVYDFGQISVAQTVADSVATIWLTPAQVLAFYTAYNASTGNYWLVAKAVTGCHYMGYPTGFSLHGEQFDAGQLQVDISTMSNSPTVTFSATWNGATTTGFNFLLGARLGYIVNPCTDGSHRARWGTLLNYSDFISDVTLPDSQTYQCGDSSQLAGGVLHSIASGVVTGVVRAGIFSGGTVSPLSAASPVNATLLWDAGVSTVTGGENLWTAPTGDNTIIIPSNGIHFAFKGTAAQGRGEVGPAPHTTASPARPSDWLSTPSTGATQAETDIADTGIGTAATAWPTPVAGSITRPGNHPFLYMIVTQPSLFVVVVADESQDTTSFVENSFTQPELTSWVISGWAMF